VSVSNVSYPGDNGDALAWVVALEPGAPAGSSCGAVTSPSATLTVASGGTTGTGSASYTAPTDSGFCQITVTVTRPAPLAAVSGATVVDQT